MRTSLPFANLIVLSIFAMPLSTALLVGQERYVHEIHADFRGKPAPKELQLMGKPPQEFLKEEPEGYRITLPDTWIHPFGGVGYRTRFGIKGDFQITAAFEILKADVPQKGYGVGAMLFLNQEEPRNCTASLARVVRANNNQIVFLEHVYKNKDGKNVYVEHKCKDTKLRLRMKRVDKALYYYWAPGFEGDNFEQIRVVQDFGDGDLTAARINAITGREPCNVDVRFISLHIGSGGLQKDPNVAPLPPPRSQEDTPAPPVEGGKSWVMVFVIIGGVLILFVAVAAVGILVLFKRRQVAGPSPAGNGVLLSFSCSSCGKSLKAKASAAGKTIKCAKCGKSVRVPDA